MKLKTYLSAILLAGLCATPAAAFTPLKASSETLVLVPWHSSGVIVIENSNRFDPLVQRLIAEGEVKRMIIVDRPLLQIPPLLADEHLQELQIRQLDQMLRR